jgi:hypothetical protein
VLIYDHEIRDLAELNFACMRLLNALLLYGSVLQYSKYVGTENTVYGCSSTVYSPPTDKPS